MTEADEVKFCSNCKRDIAARNFLMHEAHCSRNIVLCPKCEEPVPRLNLEEHNKEYHLKVTCDGCGFKLEKCNLESHKAAQCPKRPVKCKYCELELEFDKVNGHEEYCGTRTETCSICLKNIMIKDLDDHESAGCEPPSDNTNELLNLGNLDSPPPLRDQSSLASSFVRDEFARLTELARFPPVYDQASFHNVFTHNGGDFNDEELLLSYQLEKMTSEPDHTVHNLPSRRNPRRPVVPKLNTEKTVLPCEFCGSLFNSKDLHIHQTSCQSSGEMLDGRIGDHIVADFTNTVLPCEFCQIPYSMEKLTFHQAECSMNPEMTPRYSGYSNSVFVDYDDADNEEDILQTPQTAADAYANSDDLDLDQSDSLNAAIECEFCHEPFPMCLINEHELYCQPDIEVSSKESEEQKAQPRSRAVEATRGSFPNYVNRSGKSSHESTDSYTITRPNKISSVTTVSASGSVGQSTATVTSRPPLRRNPDTTGRHHQPARTTANSNTRLSYSRTTRQSTTGSTERSQAGSSNRTNQNQSRNYNRSQNNVERASRRQ